jgi:rubrerythrin
MYTLELALTLEMDLEQYYKEQAELNKENSLNVVFTKLGQEEEKHANILKNNAEKLNYSVEDNDVLKEAKKVFKELANFKSDIKDLPNQLDSYRMALEMEERSLKVYQSLLNHAVDEKAKVTYEYLIMQENIHCSIMEELVKLTSRPEEWVESAEFVLTEDY